MERTGWQRNHWMDAWTNGRTAIIDEVIVRWPREKVQQFAMRHAGEPLPDQAFPPPPAEIELVTAAGRPDESTVQRMDRWVGELLATPRDQVP